MFRAIFEYDLCIAVLTGGNPNVYYELALALAQAASRPVIILIEKGQPLPFDVKDFRVLPYDLDIGSYEAKIHIDALETFIRAFDANGWQGTDVFGPYRRTGSGPPLTPDPRSLGVKILTPQNGAVVDKVDVTGSIERMPPDGFELCSLRYYPTQHGFIPQGRVALDAARKSWTISRFDVGGDPGDPRGIVVAIAGHDARVLLEYWDAAHAVHREALRIIEAKTGGLAGARWLPAILKWPRDLLVCDRIDVTRTAK